MTLQETIEEKARIDRAYDTYSILDEAYKIKLIRIEKTVQVLHLFNSERFASKLQIKIVIKNNKTMG